MGPQDDMPEHMYAPNERAWFNADFYNGCFKATTCKKHNMWHQGNGNRWESNGRGDDWTYARDGMADGSRTGVVICGGDDVAACRHNLQRLWSMAGLGDNFMMYV